ncbi:TPA: hypothetical protein N0F65_007286 [Lagenidium giganteum]|uniref:Uncharacterized protein n=1 Tax=Lagenidium giganteum TaxID=4803 RepID=A0AAV2Z5M1_9STRA|nr:TPA: hypothetical protein N0F65_007286 [Lagenidium giganteum]
MALEEVGFWRQAGEGVDDHRPDPRGLVNHSWSQTQEARQVEWYIEEAGFVESHELAYSYCRFQCEMAQQRRRVMGACYSHYVRHHHVKPPAHFVDHVIARYAVAVQQRRQSAGQLLMWDSELQRPCAMPSAMEQWIKANTTLHRSRSNDGGRDHDPECCSCRIQ